MTQEVLVPGFQSHPTSLLPSMIDLSTSIPITSLLNIAYLSTNKDKEFFTATKEGNE